MLSKKKLEQKKANEIAKRKAEEREKAEALAADPELAAAEKKKQQDAEVASDLESMYDLMGEKRPEPKAEEKEKEKEQVAAAAPVQTTQAPPAVAALSLGGGPALKTVQDFEKYGDAVGLEVSKKGDSAKILKFLTALLKKASVTMKPEDLNALKTSVTLVHNEKQKAEQNKKKKGGGKGPTLKADRSDDFDYF